MIKTRFTELVGVEHPIVQGLIHDIPTCAELVSRIMRDAKAIIQGRLEGMMSGGRRQAAE